MALEAMNSKRKDMGLDPVKLDRRLSRSATNISRQLIVQQENTYMLPAGSMGGQVLSYVTEDPRVWSSNLEPVITDPGLRRIGIGVSFEENKETHRKTFWITLIYLVTGYLIT
jgi:hypothetical protein